ncbi:superkiller complex protein 2-like isoform X2 [Tubulanus polymorphus]
MGDEYRLDLPLENPPDLLPLDTELEKELIEKLLRLDHLPLFDLDRCQHFIPRVPNPDNLLHCDVTPLQTTLKVNRNRTTGEILGFREELLPEIGNTSKNSTSLKRAPGALADGLRGSSTNFPFWPGGLEEPEIEKNGYSNLEEEVNFTENLLKVAPGMPDGMVFPSLVRSSNIDIQTIPQTTVINITDLLGGDDDFQFETTFPEEDSVDHSKEEEMGDKITEGSDENIEDIVKNVDDEVIRTNVGAPSEQTKSDEELWAERVDVSTPVDDFHKQIPNMAYKWPFELDIFQKQAILHLENHDSVFVAAHTSAGKTVVAEYAIALSLKHMTRTIYTSPIKALSNQKFRDFRTTFEDVGLVTGDVQLHPEASCLIMTTEILRSMLYNGSDVIRDLEWVIFDEVHYINDQERGVVWEEVLIMLPSHVNIILLSATVPNTIEFAAWVGRTKRKKIYVINTLKRPVPLEHFLYTGNSNKTSNELFMILDAQRKFDVRGYNRAIEAKKERTSKSSQSFGAKGPRGSNPSQDKNVWLSVIEMLRKKDKLPVIAFTFSKKKIDENASNMQSVDLLTSSEKSEVHIFFQKCISRLKGTDRNLPQVKHMEDLLKRGIGVHHSGVLPILKEVVEMLFQKGLVKVLFATETFAMGVNMPARTVVFDNIRKHDGTKFRNLLPGEYIQMAGRAGRRGLDSTGTVIMLCKGDVPELSELHQMMLGEPTKLESQFRLTYSMMLNLLRVEQLRVQDMMKRSFSEFHSQKEKEAHAQQFNSLKEKIGSLEPVECFMCSDDLENYYKTCEEYWKQREFLQKVISSHPTTIKCLTAGRILIIDSPRFPYRLSVLLKSSATAPNKHREFTVLVICDSEQLNASNGRDTDGDDARPEFPQPVLERQLFLPDGAPVGVMATVKSSDVYEITSRTIRIDADKIVNDVRKRQQLRFRNDPPSQAVTISTQELMRLTEANLNGLSGLDPSNDLRIRDVELVERFQRFANMQQIFPTFNCINCAKFQDHFAHIRHNMKVQDEFNHLKFLLSDESLQLLPEYEDRLKVLKSLGYIDSSANVEIKGRVACEMSSHELLITELVFENVLSGLHPTEIAAALSCVVFEQKNCSEPTLSESLVAAKAKVLEIADSIYKSEKECGMVAPGVDYTDRLRFGLMEVVFEWARGMPFSEIILLTDVQEGIIVRCIQRLDEVLKDVRNAARIVGEPILQSKMEEASTLIKRDIVFAASLYTQ